MWKTIIDFPDYKVSDSGQIKSYRRVKNVGKILQCTTHGRKTGSPHFRIELFSDNQYARKYVHQLVAEYFIGPCPVGQEVRHKNGNGLDNKVENLEYGTKLQNYQDSVRHGTSNLVGEHFKGINHPSNKLTEEQVKEIRRLYAEGGHTHRSLGRLFGIAHSGIGFIVRRKLWKNI